MDLQVVLIINSQIQFIYCNQMRSNCTHNEFLTELINIMMMIHTMRKVAMKI